VQSSRQIDTTNKPTPNFFYKLHAIPVAQQCQSTEEKNVCKTIINTNEPHNKGMLIIPLTQEIKSI